MWMTHPSLPGEVVSVPDESFYGAWQALGWVSTTAPSPLAWDPAYQEVRRGDLQLSHLTDTAISSPVDGGVLQWDAASGSWKNKPSPNATYAAQRVMLPTGSRAAVIGTSLESYGDAAKTDVQAFNGPTWFNQLCTLSNQRIQRQASLAVPGALLADISTTQLASVLALSPAPNACFIGGPANDTSTGFSIATIAAAYASMVSQLRASGIVPILCLLGPRGAAGTPTATIDKNTQTFNRWVQRYASAQGLLTADLLSPLVFANGGGITAAYNQGDNTHYTAAGYAAIASDLITRQKIHEQFPPARQLTVKMKGDGTDQMAGNGVFISTAPGWSVSGTAAPVSLVAPAGSDNLAGSWLQMACASAASGTSTLFKTISVSGLTAGDTVAFSCRIQTTGLTTSGGTLKMQLKWTTGTSVFIPVLNTTAIDLSDGTVYFETTVPASTTALELDTSVAAATTLANGVNIKLGEVVLRDLTALGVDTY